MPRKSTLDTSPQHEDDEHDDYENRDNDDECVRTHGTGVPPVSDGDRARPKTYAITTRRIFTARSASIAPVVSQTATAPTIATATTSAAIVVGVIDVGIFTARRPRRR